MLASVARVGGASQIGQLVVCVYVFRSAPKRSQAIAVRVSCRLPFGISPRSQHEPPEAAQDGASRDGAYGASSQVGFDHSSQQRPDAIAGSIVG